jgi:hypothetical protein
MKLKFVLVALGFSTSAMASPYVAPLTPRPNYVTAGNPVVTFSFAAPGSSAAFTAQAGTSVTVQFNPGGSGGSGARQVLQSVDGTNFMPITITGGFYHDDSV